VALLGRSVEFDHELRAIREQWRHSVWGSDLPITLNFDREQRSNFNSASNVHSLERERERERDAPPIESEARWALGVAGNTKSKLRVAGDATSLKSSGVGA